MTAPVCGHFKQNKFLSRGGRSHLLNALPMNTDQEILQEAYANELQNLFAIFSQSALLATSDQERTTAEQRFQAGLLVIRNTRDRALALLN